MTSPIQINELFKLQSLGINPNLINLSSVTMESDKYICVRDSQSAQKMLNIIEVGTKQVTTNKVSAETAIMHPKQKVIAVRAQNRLQVYDLQNRTRLKETQMDTAVEFWKWISDSTIALVTSTSVFHWNIQSDQPPKLMFERHANLAGSTIMNYRADRTLQWLLLVGFAAGGDGTFKGVMQLFSVEKSATQPIEGHAACFIDFALSSSYTTTLISIATAGQGGQPGKLFIMEVPHSSKPPNAPSFQRKVVPIQFAQGDFPVAMQGSDLYGVIFMVTRMGYLYLFDCETGTRIHGSKITETPIFLTALHDQSNGIVGINKGGQVLVVSINKDTILQCINNMGNPDLSFKIAIRAKLESAGETFIQQFNNLLKQQNIEEAIKLAVEAPNNLLRTPQTIQRLKSYPIQTPKPPLSIYFNQIIQTSTLNEHESLELAALVLQKPGGADYIKKLIGENKLQPSEQLGDLVRNYNSIDLAISIYLKSECHDKIIECLIARGQPQNIIKYCEKVNYTPNYLDVFRKIVGAYPDEAVTFAITGTQKGDLDPNVVVDVFVQGSLVKQATHYLLEILKDNKPEDSAMQTRLLEINLLYSPPGVADSILKQEMFTHYDKLKVAQLCEKAQLYLRALENYQELNDRKRVIAFCNPTYVQPDPTKYVVDFLGTLAPEHVLVLLRELMKSNPRVNLNTVVGAASKYHDELTENDPNALISLFEEYKSNEGLFYYLSSVVNASEEPDVHFKYIQAAVKIGNHAEVERITRESDFYDPVKTKEFLKESKLSDQAPLMNVCDKHGFVEEMIHYFYKNQAIKYIDIYVKQKNPLKTPYVIGALLDADASEDFIKNLLNSVGSMCPVETLVEQVEKRNRLKLVLPWLEARANEGNTEPALHNALGKIYVDLNQNPEQFLLTNVHYDPRVVGKYCERRDQHLAFVAYKKGQCDEELINLCYKNGMFKQLARYLVTRQDADLWETVLANEEHRRQVIDQVVQTALPETTNAEQVSSTVKAFIAADLPQELLELLEQIVLQGNSEFRKNTHLQNLLILTAIKADPSRVMDYINRLDKYDAPDIAGIACEKGLYEEAFTIYSKFKLHTNAVKVLIEQIDDIQRAADYADKVQNAEVFSLLGRAQLAAELVSEAVSSFMKAHDPNPYREVIQVAEKTGHFEDLITFLQMARTKVQDSLIDSELIYSFAKFAEQTQNNAHLAELEDFISSPNQAQIKEIGDRCFDEGLYEAARILYQSISLWSSLAATFVKLGKHREAVNAALKANSTKVFKEVMAACVEAGDFKYAQQCALNILNQADEVDDLVHFYEVRGYWEEIIEVLEKGLAAERPVNAIYTSLGVLYAKYRPEKLMDHIQRCHKKANKRKLMTACEQNHLWAELRFLLCVDDEFDNAIRIMMQHSPEAWDHTIFTETILKVVNMELYYRSIHFYLEEQPSHLVDLLKVLTPKLDHERVAREVKASGNLALIKEYLIAVQDTNLVQINECLNELLIEEEDYEALRESIEHHDNFDHITLAKTLENHDLLEFRRIASHLYKQKKQYQNSISLSKKDKLYKDAMDTAAQSGNTEIAEQLLKFFVDNDLKECFAACLYTCYNLVRPDVAMEYAWRHKIQDMAMPFFIQVIREYTSKVDKLYKSHKDSEKQKKEQNKLAEMQVNDNSFYPPGPPPPVFPDAGPFVGAPHGYPFGNM